MDLLAEAASRAQVVDSLTGSRLTVNTTDQIRATSLEDLAAAEQLDALRTSYPPNTPLSAHSSSSNKRQQISAAEKEILLKYFNSDLAPKRKDREQVAEELNEMIRGNPERFPLMASGQAQMWTERRVQIFFQNQRASMKKKAEKKMIEDATGEKFEGNQLTDQQQLHQHALKRKPETTSAPLLPSPLTPSQDGNANRAISPGTSVPSISNTKPAITNHPAGPEMMKSFIPKVVAQLPTDHTVHSIRPLAPAPAPSIITIPNHHLHPHHFIANSMKNVHLQEPAMKKMKPSPILPRPPLHHPLPNLKIPLPPKQASDGNQPIRPLIHSAPIQPAPQLVPMSFFIPGQQPNSRHVAPNQQPMLVMMSPNGNLVPVMYQPVARPKVVPLSAATSSVPSSPVVFTAPVHHRPSLSVTAPTSSTTSPVAFKFDEKSEQDDTDTDSRQESIDYPFVESGSESVPMHHADDDTQSTDTQ